MLARVDDYTSLHPVRVSVLSWNVGAKKPPGDAELGARRAVAGRVRRAYCRTSRSGRASAATGRWIRRRLSGGAVQWEAAVTRVLQQQQQQQQHQQGIGSGDAPGQQAYGQDDIGQQQQGREGSCGQQRRTALDRISS